MDDPDHKRVADAIAEIIRIVTGPSRVENERLRVRAAALTRSLQEIIDIAENAAEGEGLGVQRNAMLVAARAALQ